MDRNMDAITMNGSNEGLGNPVFNYLNVPQWSYFNTPDFLNASFGAPNVIPENNLELVGLSSFGISSIFKGEFSDSYTMIDSLSGEIGEIIELPNVTWINVDMSVFDYVKKEADLISEYFGLPENAFPVSSPHGLNRIGFQDLLDVVWANAAAVFLPQLYTDVVGSYQTSFPNPTFVPFWNDPNFVEFDQFGWPVFTPPPPPFVLPYQVYGRGDVFRYRRFLSNCHNFLSFAYGTQQVVNVFDPRDSFFDRLWANVKKFFPLMIVSRNAFRGLVALNVFSLADRIADGDRAKIKATWEGFGGTFSSLEAAVVLGANRGIGDGGATALLITSATPIILTIISILGDEDDYQNASQIATLLNSAVDAECRQYVAIMANFIISYNLEDLTTEQLSSEFAAAFPQIPSDCVDGILIAYEEGASFVDDLLDNDSPGTPVNPALPPGVPQETDSNNILILGAGIIAINKFL